MQLLHEPSDPHVYETLLHLARNATEAPFANTRIQVGTVNLSCTANVPQSKSVTFGKPFKKGVTPVVKVGIVGMDNPASQITASGINATNTAFTAQVYSSVTQNVTLSYVAIGQV